MSLSRRAVAVLACLLLLLIAVGIMGRQGTGMTELALSGPIDPYAPVIDLDAIGLDGVLIAAMGLEADGHYLPLHLDLAGNKLRITGPNPADAALDLNGSYTLTIYNRNGRGYRIGFTTTGLPDLTSNGRRRVIMVPAMPEEGFHWPYFLVLPSDAWKSANQEAKRYLVVEPNNTGPARDAAEMLSMTRQHVNGSSMFSLFVAEQLWAPVLVPAFPRPSISYSAYGEYNALYIHALDRDTAILHLLMQDPAVVSTLEPKFAATGFPAEAYLHLDRQVVAMIEHAVAYLNRYDHQVEPKALLVGYSASGTFVDRFATLHPHKVKAVVSGGTLDDLMLPLADYHGEELIFPIGTSDYDAITGRPFDLSAHNQVARLIFMGESDNNNTLPYTDCYGEREREIITRLWGEAVLPRAVALTELYGAAGGHGIFILDKGVEHSMSQEMIAHVREFLAANRHEESPVYPLPSKPEQLSYILHR